MDNHEFDKLLDALSLVLRAHLDMIVPDLVNAAVNRHLAERPELPPPTTHRRRSEK